MRIDAHCHLGSCQFDTDREEVFTRMLEEQVEGAILICCNIDDYRKALVYKKKHPLFKIAVGIHPQDLEEDDSEERLQDFCAFVRKEKPDMIGEIGLDYHYNLSEPDVQRYWFRRQIQLANELKMPIVIHSREADQECMDILKEEGAFSDERCSWFPKRKGPNGQMVKDARVLLHCFSGSREMAEQYVKLGATISIAGPVTYKNNKKTPEVVKAIPIEFLLVETDAPYLTPEPFRGKKNKSPLVEYTARHVAALKEMEYEDVARQTCENAKVFYGIE
jgi:TatD DNase family protein